MERKLRIAYCEDEAIQIEYMNMLLKAYEKKHKTEIEFYGYKSAKEFLFEQEGCYAFSAIFLDIDMKDVSGMELAKEIRKKDETVPIIFLTNRKEYVFEGYEVQAFLYLLKPIDERKLEQILTELFKRQKQDTFYIMEKQERETIKIDVSKICYFEANGHYLNVCCIDSTYVIKKSLQEIMNQFQERFRQIEKSGFLLTHRSFFVNLEYIEKITKAECILVKNYRVPISRKEYKNVNQKFLEYYKAKK